jgi:hypothetical protein
MTWLGDTNKKLPDAEKETLLAKRATLVKQVEALKKAGPKGKMAHQIRHHAEDMAAVAAEILKIDKKLGR